MKFGLIDNVRSMAGPGGRGQCQFCGRPLVAKCGAVVVWHWAHAPRCVCDPWWENETEWHRKWKNCFPNSWQEVIHFDSSGEKHIADVKTDDGLVIELQHSSIKPEELRSRETFYGNMLWIVDGSSFKNNFHILSRLPPADSILATRLKIFREPQFPLDTNHPKFTLTNQPIFLLDIHEISRGENYVAYDVCRVAGDRINSYSRTRETEAEIDAAYDGDHFLKWVRPRTVWLSTSKPVFVDLGERTLWQLNRFQTKFWAVKAISAKKFVERLGGVWT